MHHCDQHERSFSNDVHFVVSFFILTTTFSKSIPNTKFGSLVHSGQEMAYQSPCRTGVLLFPNLECQNVVENGFQNVPILAQKHTSPNTYSYMHTPSLVLRLLLFISPSSRNSFLLVFSSSVSRGRPRPRFSLCGGVGLRG